MRAYVHNDGPLPKVYYRCDWARSWLKNAGLVENSGRGVWTLTAERRAALAGGDDGAILRRVRQASYAARKGASVDDDEAPASAPATDPDSEAAGWQE